MQTQITHGKGALAATLLGAALVLGACGQGKPPADGVPKPADVPVAPTREQVLAATVTGVFEAPVTLVAGVYEGTPAQPDAASRPRLRLWDSTVQFVDLDGTPPQEAIALLTSDSGGSGSVTHLGAFGVAGGQARTLATVALGDRVQVFRMWHEPGKVLLDLIEPGADDPVCCPTQVTRRTFGWKDGTLQSLASAAAGGLSINLLAATDWMLVEMDGQTLPADTLPPTTVIQYGKAAGFAGCNRYTATIEEASPGTIKLGEPAVTRKACPGAASEVEAAFLQRLRAVTSYSFQAGRLVLVAPRDGQAPHTLVFSR